LYQSCNDSVAFYIVYILVYILVAYASDIWQMPSNVSQHVVFANPENLDERYDLASSCVRNLHLSIPALIDNFDNTTETAYTGRPDRLI
jgi:hypothetical protein